MRAAGLEPATRGLKGRCASDATSDVSRCCDNRENNLATCLARIRENRPDLATVAEHWDQLSEEVKAGIVAMVRTATKRS